MNYHENSLIQIPLNYEKGKDKCSYKYEEYQFIFKPSNINYFIKDLQKKFVVNDGLDTLDIELNVLHRFCNQQPILHKLYNPTILENMKNRYSDVLISDEYRVKLPLLADDPSSSFINATYLYNILPNTKKFIAASAPVAAGFREWWRMVYEKNVCMIVMLTKLTETNKRSKRSRPEKYIKAHQYWPEYTKHRDGSILDKDATFDPYILKNNRGDINLLIVRRFGPTNKIAELKDMNLNNDQIKQIEIFLVTMFNLSLQIIGSRKIVFIWNRSLPDYGAPIKNKHCDQFAPYRDFVILFNRLYNKYNNNKRPVVVHCSAGLGRTGFFITIDMILDNISRNYLGKIKSSITGKNNQLQKINLLTKKQLVLLPAISVFEVVKCLRTRRPMMVSNKAQYVFIYLFIAYWLQNKVEK